jgi:hypothetical protein
MEALLRGTMLVMPGCDVSAAHVCSSRLLASVSRVRAASLLAFSNVASGAGPSRP